jgi:hypothetical protein
MPPVPWSTGFEDIQVRAPPGRWSTGYEDNHVHTPVPQELSQQVSPEITEAVSRAVLENFYRFTIDEDVHENSTPDAHRIADTVARDLQHTRQGQMVAQSGVMSVRVVIAPGMLVSMPADTVTAAPALDTMVAQWAQQRFASQEAQRMKKLQREAMANLVKSRSRVMVLDEDQVEACPICLEKMKKHQSATVLPCFHRLHSQCCSKYYRSANTKPLCPICRFDISTPLTISS